MAAPKTVKTYPMDGVQKDFEIPFEYLARKFVVVTLIGPDRKQLTLNVDYRFTSRTVITVTRAWDPSEGYTLIEIKRVTSATERLVDFSDGSILRAVDLNTATIQGLHISEEGRDIATDTIAVDNAGNLDARGRRITNVGNAVNDSDAVNLGQVRGWDNSALNSADRAAASATQADESADEAEAWAAAAATSASEAQNLPRTVRVGPNDPYLAPLPDIAGRAHKLLGFDSDGMPTVLVPQGGSAGAVLLELQKPEGASKVGYISPAYTTVEKALDAVLDGSAEIPYERNRVARMVKTLQALGDSMPVSVWEYIYAITDMPDPEDPSTWDWTPAFVDMVYFNQSSVDSAAPTKGDRTFLIPAGNEYHVTSVIFSKHQNVIMCGGVLKPLDSTASADFLLKFTGYNRLYNLNIDMDYAVNYQTAIWCRGRYMDFMNCSIWKQLCAYFFGDPAWISDPALGVNGDSEISVSGGEINWGLTVAKAFGQNTIVTFDKGCRAYSFKRSIVTEAPSHPNYAAWMALADTTFVNYGAMVYLTGCFTGNYSDVTPTLLSEIGPVSGSPDYKNRYGSYILNSTHIETGVLFATGDFGSAYPAQDEQSHVLQMSGCHGYMTGTSGWWVSLGGKCLQKVDIRSCGFYGNAYSRLVYALGAQVHVDKESFGNATSDFHQSMYVMNPKGYKGQWLLDAYGSTQAVPSALTTLAMPQLRRADMHDDARSQWYSSGTGEFTARVDLGDVEITVALTFDGALASEGCAIQVLVDGQQVDFVSGAGVSTRLHTKLRRVVRGSKIVIKAAQNAGRALSGRIDTYVRISANT